MKKQIDKYSIFIKRSLTSFIVNQGKQLIKMILSEPSLK